MYAVLERYVSCDVFYDLSGSYWRHGYDEPSEEIEIGHFASGFIVVKHVY